MSNLVTTTKKITLCETSIELDEEEKKNAEELKEKKRKRKEEEEEAEFQRKIAEDNAKYEEEMNNLETEGQAMSAAVINSPDDKTKSISLTSLVGHFHGTYREINTVTNPT